MEHIPFALKYRPKNFDEVIGQAHVVAALQNAIIKKHLHHAYLFSGPRGTGKTSLARIFAKSLNCFEGPTIKPCEKCTSCLEINKLTAMDVIEIDGASNRGIEEIRSLRENIKLAPTYSRYKIYIIDEVHMLSQDAFGALLKTLEEPPEHVKFIFATTHIHKILPTILSRCQKFQFSLVSIEDIFKKLKKIIDAENLNVEDNILYAISRIADGSIRDAESLLDQLVPVITNKTTTDDIFAFLGIISEETLNETLKNIAEKNLDAILTLIDSLSKNGKDLGLFLNALIEHIRNLLLIIVSPKSFEKLISVSPHTKNFLKNYAGYFSVHQILTILDLLFEVKELSSRLLNVRIPLELAFIKYMKNFEVKNSKNTDNDSSQNLPNPSINSNQKNFKLSTKTIAEKIDSELEETELTSKKNIEIEATLEENTETQDDNLIANQIKSKWHDIILSLQKKRAAIAAHLSFGQPVSSSGVVVKIGFLKKDYFHKEVVESSKNLKFIEEEISKILNKKIGINFIFSENIEPLNSIDQKFTYPANQQTQNNQTATDTSEFINNILEEFGGSIDSGMDIS